MWLDTCAEVKLFLALIRLIFSSLLTRDLVSHIQDYITIGCDSECHHPRLDKRHRQQDTLHHRSLSLWQLAIIHISWLLQQVCAGYTVHCSTFTFTLIFFAFSFTWNLNFYFHFLFCFRFWFYFHFNFCSHSP